MGLVFRFLLNKKEHYLEVNEIFNKLLSGEINKDTQVFNLERRAWIKYEQYQKLIYLIQEEEYSRVESTNDTRNTACREHVITNSPDDNNKPISKQNYSFLYHQSNPLNTDESKKFVLCKSCHHKCSKRALTCPKCGADILTVCSICLNEISVNSEACPECGDPKPFLGNASDQLDLKQSPQFLEKENSADYQVLRSQEPSGVGGWLLLLVLGMMVFGPLIGAARVYTGIGLIEQFSTEINLLDSWRTYKILTWTIFFVLAACSIYSGWRLCKSLNWSAVRQAKIVLWIIGPISSTVFAIILPSILFDSIVIDNRSIGALIGSCIGVYLWTIYLSKSVRVYNTYSGPNILRDKGYVDLHKLHEGMLDATTDTKPQVKNKTKIKGELSATQKKAITTPSIPDNTLCPECDFSNAHWRTHCVICKTVLGGTH